MLTPHTALVHIMVMVAAADGDMPDDELQRMGQVCRLWPVFKGFDIDTLPDVARECAVMLQVGDGLEKALARVRQAVPASLRETAYLLACDVAAVDAQANWQETRVLDRLRHALDLDRLTGAALERAAAARYAAVK
jgi:tellurite resistance protein